MKKLIAIFMSFQLIITPVVMATENPDYELKTHKDLKNGGYDFYAKQILQIGTSIIGANILIHCPLTLKTPSLATYMAGSLTHIISEFAGAKSLTDGHNKKMNDLKILKEELKREGGQVQKAALETRLAEERAALQYVKSRLIWMAAVTTIYLAAMGLAIAEQLTATTAGNAAGVSTCAMAVAPPLASPCGIYYYGCYLGHFAGCAASQNVGSIANQSAFAVPGLPVGPGDTACTATGIYMAGCQANLKAYMGIAYAGCIPGAGLGSSMLMQGAYVAAFDLLMQKTGGGKTDYFKMINTLLIVLVPTLSTKVMATFNYPIPRSITFGASAVLAGAITLGLDKRKGIHEKNVKDLEEVVANFKLTTDDVNGVDLGGISGPPLNPLATGSTQLPNGGIRGLANPNALNPVCASNANGTFQYSEGACANPIRMTRPSFNMETGVNALNDVGQMANDLANAISSGQTSRAEVLAGQIASQAARIRGVNKELEDKLNDLRKNSKDKYKEKPIDFDGDIKKQVASMQSEFNKVANAKGLAGMSPDAMLGDDLRGEEVSSGETSPTLASIPDMEMPSADSGLSNIGGSGEAGSGGTSDLFPAAKKTPSLSESLNQFETNEADIVKDSTISIFKQLSNRYILNYTKIFSRKEPTPEPVSNSPKKE